MNQEAYVLYCQTAESAGGLGWSSTRVGISMALGGFLLLIFQMYIYPPCQRLRGNWSLFRDSMLLCAPVYFITCCMTNVKDEFAAHFGYTGGQVALWAFTFVHHCLRVGLHAFAFTSIMVSINNSVSKKSLSLVNGIAQSLASLTRAVGPVLCGLIWQYSLKNGLGYPLNYHFVFIVLSALTLVGYFVATRIPRSVNS